jgi:hypothetical protein
LAQQQAVAGAVVDLLIGRVEDGVGEGLLPELNAIDRGLDEVPALDFVSERGFGHKWSQRTAQLLMKTAVKLEGGQPYALEAWVSGETPREEGAG